MLSLITDASPVWKGETNRNPGTETSFQPARKTISFAVFTFFGTETITFTRTSWDRVSRSGDEGGCVKTDGWWWWWWLGGGVGVGIAFPSLQNRSSTKEFHRSQRKRKENKENDLMLGLLPVSRATDVLNYAFN